MGGATWSASTYASTSATYRTMDRSQLFNKSKVREDFDPKNITIRESCDSQENPNSTPVIVALDVTGSMGFISEFIAKESLGTLVEGILDKQPISDPHIMCMAIGDIFSDQAPLQATQFEADIRIAEQLTDLWLEGRGGGNSFESYDLPWLFAAHKTKIDSYDKRGVKGYLFTIGDELPPTTANHTDLNNRIGTQLQGSVTSEQMLAEAQEKYNVFHIIVEEGSFARRRLVDVKNRWTNLLGKKAICLNNYKYISEVIQSVMEVNEGVDPEEVISQWEDPQCQKTVEYALYGSAQR